MTSPGKSLAVLIGCALTAAAAPPTAGLMPPGSPTAMSGSSMSPMGAMTSAGPSRIVVSEVVEPAFRDAVARVMGKPTLSARGTCDEVLCTPSVYDWLVDHPDRVALAWRRLKVPCVEITDLGNGRFAWAEDGSELVWQTVGRFPDGVVWYATGKVKPAPVGPTVPVRAVVVMSYPKQPAAGGLANVRPVAQAYLHTDSRAANMVMRMLGPTAPKLAQEGAEQLLFFFNGVARYAQAHPDQADALLGPAKK
jgi:hypothetical protein